MSKSPVTVDNINIVFDHIKAGYCGIAVLRKKLPNLSRYKIENYCRSLQKVGRIGPNWEILNRDKVEIEENYTDPYGRNENRKLKIDGVYMSQTQANKIKMVDRINTIFDQIKTGNYRSLGEVLAKFPDLSLSQVTSYCKVLKNIGRLDNEFRVLNPNKVEIEENISDPWGKVAKQREKRLMGCNKGKQIKSKVKKELGPEPLSLSPLNIPLSGNTLEIELSGNTNVMFTPKQVANLIKCLMEVNT